MSIASLSAPRPNLFPVTSPRGKSQAALQRSCGGVRLGSVFRPKMIDECRYPELFDALAPLVLAHADNIPPAIVYEDPDTGFKTNRYDRLRVVFFLVKESLKTIAPLNGTHTLERLKILMALEEARAIDKTRTALFHLPSAIGSLDPVDRSVTMRVNRRITTVRQDLDPDDLMEVPASSLFVVPNTAGMLEIEDNPAAGVRVIGSTHERTCIGLLGAMRVLETDESLVGTFVQSQGKLVRFDMPGADKLDVWGQRYRHRGAYIHPKLNIKGQARLVLIG